MYKNKSLNILLNLMLISFLMSGCSTLTVNKDYDTAYDFSKLKTYSLLPLSKDSNIDMINAGRVNDAIKTNLNAKGYDLAEQSDFGVTMHFGKQTITTVDSYGYGYGYGYWGARTIDVNQYDEGTLIIDIIDIAKNQLVWRGYAKGAMKDSPTIQERTENINYVVSEILAQFPPDQI